MLAPFSGVDVSEDRQLLGPVIDHLKLHRLCINDALPELLGFCPGQFAGLGPIYKLRG